MCRRFQSGSSQRATPLLQLVKLESPTRNVILNMENRCTSRPNLLTVVSVSTRGSFFFTFLALCWDRHGNASITDGVLTVADGRARMLLKLKPIALNLEHQEYGHRASRSGTLMVTTAHGHPMKRTLFFLCVSVGRWGREGVVE